MQPTHSDLWGVWSQVEALREKSRSPLFAEWTAKFLQEMQESLTATPDPETVKPTELAVQAEKLGFAYVLTGDEALLQAGVQTLETLVALPRPWHYVEHSGMYPEDTADLLTADASKAASSAVSFLWPGLTEEQRKRLITAIADKGGQPIYNGAKRGCWWGNALNSNWTAVLNSGLGFSALLLALYDPERAAPWLEFVTARLTEMLDLAQEEGAGIEGTGYWLYCFGSLQDFIEAARNTGAGNRYDHPFWSVCSRFLPYLVLPDWSAWVNYADTGYKGLGGCAFFHGVAARKQDGLAQYFANEVNRRQGGLSWKSLVYYDPTVAEQPLAEEPPCRFFESIHLASFRSGWEEDAVFMMFKGGSNAWSHTHLDLNSFFITGYGERLATEPGPEPYSLAYWHSIQPVVSTAWHNCIVVDGAHQRVPAQYAMSYDLEEAGDCYSRLSDHLSSPDLEMIRGDASVAYGDQLERAWRDIVFLKPGVFIIYDDLLTKPVRCQRNIEWMLHSECPFTDIAGGMEAVGEKATLRIQPVFPEGWEHKYVERHIPHAKEEHPLYGLSVRPYWHHKWNVDPSRSPYPQWDGRCETGQLYGQDCQYLVVLSAIKAGEQAPYELTKLAAGSAQGVQLTGEGETAVVLFNHSGETVELGGVRTDAEKVVVRAYADRITWAVVRGTTLWYDGHELLSAANRVSTTGLSQ